MLLIVVMFQNFIKHSGKEDCILINNFPFLTIELPQLNFQAFYSIYLIQFIWKTGGCSDRRTVFHKEQNRSTEGCSKLKRSVDMTSSGKNGLNIRTNASPKWDGNPANKNAIETGTVYIWWSWKNFFRPYLLSYFTPCGREFGTILPSRWASRITASQYGSLGLSSIDGKRPDPTTFSISCRILVWTSWFRIRYRAAHLRVVAVVSDPATKKSLSVCNNCRSIREHI